MDVFSRMLVAVDGSAASDAAVRLGLEIARAQRRGATRYVAVFDRDAQAEETICRDALDAATRTARAAGVEAEATMRIGRPVHEILEEAGAWNATCIALGTNGRSGLAYALFGSCAEGVLHRSARPVLVARDTRTSPGSIERLLCAFDGSPAARQAFDAAVAFAADCDAEIHLVSVVQLDDFYATGYERDGFDPDGSVGALYDDARRTLKSLASEAIARGVRVAPHVVGGAGVASIIAGCAAQYGCGLVLMGTHGRNAIGRAVLRSTAEGVIHGAAAPVLAFHGRAHVSDVPDEPAAIADAQSRTRCEPAFTPFSGRRAILPT